MQIKRILTLCVVVTLICSCNNDVAQKSNRTIISGQVINRTEGDPTVMTWNLCDPFNDDRIGVRLSEDGHFHMETEGINLFHNMTIVCGNFINLFAAPGDSIYVVIDAAKMKTGASNAVHFSGDRAEENNELYTYYNHMSHIINSDLRHNRLDMDLEPKAMIAHLNERVNRYQDSVAIYEKQQKVPMSDNLRDFMRRDMIFALANQLLSYKDDNVNAQLELFGDPFFGISDSLNFSTMLFPYHLNVYMNTKVFSDTTVNSAWHKSDYSTLMRNGMRILMNEPASFSRDVMVWQFLSDMIEVSPELYDSIPEVQTIFTSSQLNDKFSKLAQYEKTEFPPTILDGINYLESNGEVTALAEGDIFAHLAQKYSGKVVYIDVYATWCGPCRAEMKDASPALHNLMKEKDVVFVNLCLASKAPEWREIITQFDLTENYLFDSDASSLFMATYNIPGYPTYILMGKDGKIATLRAERPSHLAEAAKQIDDLLKND